MVVTLLGIVASFAIPRVNFAQYRTDAAVRLARATMQRAERLAVTRQFNIIVSFDVPRSAIRLVEDANNNSLVDAGERLEWKGLEDGVKLVPPPIGLSGTTAAGVAGSGLRMLDGMPSVIFRRNGAASTDLELYLSGGDQGAVGSTSGPDFRAVSVVQSTGRVKAFRYVGGAWKVAEL